jgi:predicted ribosomally synthesized peptide with nif11-like leader
MSKEAALAFHERLKKDSTLRCKVDDGAAPEEVAREEGYDCTADELEAAAGMTAAPSGELTGEELDNVSGGTDAVPVRAVTTVKMKEDSRASFKKGTSTT